MKSSSASTPTASTTPSQAESHRLRGYLFIAGAALFWGISATLGRAVFTGRLLPGASASPIDPLILAQTRTTFALMVLAPVLVIRRGTGILFPARSDVLKLVLLGVLGTAASNYFYYLSIQLTNVATAIILQYTAPIWVLLYMVLRGNDRATARRVTSVALAVVGAAMAIGLFGQERLRLDTVGVIAAQLAAIAFAYYNIAGSGLVARLDRWQVLMYALGGAVVFWALINPPWEVVRAGYTGSQWVFLAVFAVTSSLIPFSFYISGLQYLDPTRAIVTSSLEPVLSILIAAVFLSETFTLVQAIGMVIVLVATVLVQAADKNNRVEPIE